MKTETLKLIIKLIMIMIISTSATLAQDESLINPSVKPLFDSKV